MRVEYFIALRHLKARWRQTLVSILSVAVGVMILTTALSLTNGFEGDLVDKILGTTPHISIKPGIRSDIAEYRVVRSKLIQHKDIKYIFPRLKKQAMIANPIHTTGTLVYGANPTLEKDYLKKYLIQGYFLDGGEPSIVVGSELAKKLQLFVGDKVQLGILSNTTPLVNEFKVMGIFRSGLYELDVRLVLMPLKLAQQYYQTGDTVNELSIQLKEPFAAAKLLSPLQQEFPSLYIRTWMDSNQSLLNAMALEKRVIFLVILFIIVVAMVGITNTLVMIVIEKTSDISIIRAIGASRKQVSFIFLLQGVGIGIMGILLGSLLGVGCSMYLTHFPIRIPGDVYDLNYIPVDMRLNDFLIVAASTFVICLLASFFPARRAVRLEPIETIRRQI